MQDYVVNHVVLVLRLVQAEGAAEVFLMSRFRLVDMVASLHVHLQGSPKKNRCECKIQNVFSNERSTTNSIFSNSAC